MSAVLFFTLDRGGSLIEQYRHLDWSSIVLGLAVVGLEGGTIYMYKAGWDVSAGQLTYSAILAVLLVAIGHFRYHEAITWSKLAGVLVCMVGLYLIDR